MHNLQSNKHEKILAMMSGCDAQHPMSFDDLVKKSGLQPGALNLILLQMYDCSPRTINYATITKGGKTQTVYWPTGVVNSYPGSQSIGVNGGHVFPRQPEPVRRVPVQPAAKPIPSILKEIQDMTSQKNGSTPSKLNAAITKHVQAYPGISQQSIIRVMLQRYPDETEKHIKKTLSNMLHVSKKLYVKGSDLDRGYYLVGGAVKEKTAAQPKPTKAKPEPKKAAAPKPKQVAAPSPATPTPLSKIGSFFRRLLGK